MNSVFREVVASSIRGVGELSHTQRVTRAYRKALRLSLDWGVSRPNFYALSADVRAKFEAGRAVAAGSSEAEAMISKAEAMIVDYTHPDSYVLPGMPGGSKFMRNPPPPLEAVFPDGIPAEVNVASQTVEGVQVPQSATPEGYDRVLIVPYSKTAQ